jgi:2-oxoglutarate ferredoxin oxidoreductase subunit beta
VHDAKEESGTLAWTLSRFDFPAKPVPLGIFRSVERPTYNDLMDGQIKAAQAAKGTGDLKKLLNSGFTWKV